MAEVEWSRQEGGGTQAGEKVTRMISLGDQLQQRHQVKRRSQESPALESPRGYRKMNCEKGSS